MTLDLAALEQLLADVDSLLPWAPVAGSVHSSTWWGQVRAFHDGAGELVVAEVDCISDAALIAAAINALPELLALAREAETLRGERDTAERGRYQIACRELAIKAERDKWYRAAHDGIDAMAEKLSQAEAERDALRAEREGLAALLRRSRTGHYAGECGHCGIDELPEEDCPTVKFNAEVDAALKETP